jgi:hypothetical protein
MVWMAERNSPAPPVVGSEFAMAGRLVGGAGACGGGGCVAEAAGVAGMIFGMSTLRDKAVRLMALADQLAKRLFGLRRGCFRLSCLGSDKLCVSSSCKRHSSSSRFRVGGLILLPAAQWVLGPYDQRERPENGLQPED